VHDLVTLTLGKHQLFNTSTYIIKKEHAHKHARTYVCFTYAVHQYFLGTVGTPHLLIEQMTKAEVNKL